MSGVTDRYLQSVDDLEYIVGIAMTISADTYGRQVDSWRLEYGSSIFAKLCLHALAALQLRPEVDPQSPNQLEVWDISSVCVVIRAVIDSYYVFFYLAVDECDESMQELRYHVWEYHGEKQRLDMLRKMRSENPIIQDIEKRVTELKSLIIKNHSYEELPVQVQRRIRKGDRGILVSNTELSKQAGIDPDYYKANFNYLSAYVHAFPFAASQLAAFRAGDDESLQVIIPTLDTCIGYVCHGVRDMVELFPDQAEHVDDRAQLLIDKWNGIFQDINSSPLDYA